MPRSAPLAGLALAALLALGACSSSDDDAAGPAASADTPGAAPGATASADATTSAGATDPTGTAPGQDDGAGAYSAAKLAAVLESVQVPGGSALQVVPADQLDDGIDMTREFLDSVKITPEECEVFLLSSMEAPEGAAYAAGVASSDTDASQTIVSVASSADTIEEDRIEASLDALDTCSSFSVETQGVVIDQTIRRLDATTDADRTVGTLATQSADGLEQETMTVVGLQGDLTVTAARTAEGVMPEGSQEDLQDLVDATLAAAR